MPVYLVMLAFVVLAGIPLCSKKCGRAGRIIFCVAAAAVFTFVAAARFKVGYDYNLYGGLYFNMKYMELIDIPFLRQEKGFLLPFYILNLANEEYYYAFIYTSLAFYPALFTFIYKNSERPWLSAAAFLCFGIYFNSLCFLRQFLAAIIMLYAIKFISGKNPLRFMALSVIASAFHWSALIWLLLYFLVKIRPGYLYLGIIATGTTVFCLFSRTLMLWLIEHFEMYGNYNPDTNVEASNGLSPMYSVMFGVLFLLSFIFRKRLIQKNPMNSVYINCLMYTTVFEIMGTRHAILSRFALLTYLPPILYMLPDLLDSIHDFLNEKTEGKGIRKPLITTAAVFGAMFSFACYILLINGNYNGVNPYISQFHKTEEIFVEYTDAETTDKDDAQTEPETDSSPTVTTTGGASQQEPEASGTSTTQDGPADNPAELEEDILNALEQLG